MSRIYRCTFHCHHANGVLVQPSLHYQTDVSIVGSEPDPDDVASGVWTLLGSLFKACLHSEVTVDQVVALEEVVPPAIGVSGAHTVNQVGTFTSLTPTVSHALVPVIDLHTATRSRSARGWIMMASPRIANTSGDNWETPSGFVTALTDLAGHLSDSFDLGSVDPTHVHPVIYSRTRAVRGQTPTTFRVTSATLNPQARWLKRRLTSP